MRALLIALIATANIACVTKPTMHLNHAEITGAQLTFPPSVAMVVVLDVYNPNSYDVAVRAVKGQAIMADIYPLAVDFQAPPEGVWMTAGKTTQLRVPLLMPVALGLQLLQQAWNTPVINYRFIGKANVTGTRTFQIEKDDYSVDEKGSITRDQIAQIIPNTFAPPPPQPPR